MGLQKVAQSVGSAITKNLPSILTGLGVAGVFSTTALAIGATPKAMKILDDEKRRLNHEINDGTNAWQTVELTKPEIIKLTWKCYIPAIIMGTVTAGCIIGANSINLNRNAALAGLYSLSETALKEYQAKVVQTIGESKERAIKDELAKDKVKQNPLSSKEVIVTGKGEMLCLDAYSGRYFESSVEDIRQAINSLNHDLLSDMLITLNDVYYSIGLKDNTTGEMLGWKVEGGLIEPEFSTQLAEDGRPCIVLSFKNRPVLTYAD